MTLPIFCMIPGWIFRPCREPRDRRRDQCCDVHAPSRLDNLAGREMAGIEINARPV
jgi:hypothetical protein